MEKSQKWNSIMEATPFFCSTGGDERMIACGERMIACGERMIVRGNASMLQREGGLEPQREVEYVFIRRLGKGMFGEVFEVLEQSSGRRMALKVLAEDVEIREGAQLLREARILSQFCHPGIPTVYDLGVLSHGRPYFTMELIDGQTLESWLVSSSFSLQGACRIIEALCDILSYVHQKGMVHRDLKPSNILIGVDDEVSLVDWGISEVFDKEFKRPGKPEYWMKGTPMYIAPEIVMGKPFTPSADQYALGMILYQCLTKKLPFVSHDLRTLFFQACCQTPHFPKQSQGGEETTRLQDICRRLLHKSPKRRFASVSELATALRDVRQEARRNPVIQHPFWFLTPQS